MIEIISNENLEFVLEETNRIREFSEKHYDGNWI